MVTAAVGLISGLGGAAGYAYLEGAKAKDPSKQEAAEKAKTKGGDSKKGEPQGHAAGQPDGGGSTNDSGSEIPGFTSAEDADTLKKQIGNLSSRFDQLQQRVDSMSLPRDVSPPDIGTLQIKMGELSRTVGEVANLPSRFRQTESKVDRLQEEFRSVRDQLSSIKERGGTPNGTPAIADVDRRVDALAGPAPAPPTSILPSDPNSADATMAEAIALFKRGKYPEANDIFRKLQLTRPQDARVWYYSALARGLATGRWDGDARQFVVQGAERERAGMPSTSQIDTAFTDLSPAQGKDWLDAYRSQLIKH